MPTRFRLVESYIGKPEKSPKVYRIIDKLTVIAECDEEKYAEMIVNALNAINSDSILSGLLLSK